LLDARGLPLEFCTPEQIERATGIAERPATPWAAVNPLDSPDRYLSLAVVSIPLDACVGYHSHVGATILYVQAGTIEYAANGLLNPAGLEIRRGRDGSGTPPAGVPFWVPITLGAGEWVSQNTDAWHSFRNVGDEPAVVLV
jgi:quercetin dioxygenase-like cupin family protein